MRLGVIAIARPTFDVEFAQASASTAVATLRRAGHDLVGSADLAMDLDAVGAAADDLARSRIEALVVLQASFADSSLAVRASAGETPLVLWAFPEERAGGRLRLNSFCGINLAGHALTNLDRSFRWLYRPADDTEAADEIVRLVRSETTPPGVSAVTDVETFPESARQAAMAVRDRLRSTTVGRVGERPDGFEPCRYDRDAARRILGVRVDEVPLPELFARADAADPEALAAARRTEAGFLAGLDDVDQDALNRSLALEVGLRSLVDERAWAGVATRCWPETFTEFGGAACAPMAMLTEAGTPGACEADVYGNLTGLVLSWLARGPSFVADLVHLDPADGTGVLWHCGLAPVSMADPESTPMATIHTNRRKPLLHEFPLKPGRVTLARISQSRNRHRLVVGGGEMVRRPLAFSGTAGVVHFDRLVEDVMTTVLDEGLEHHYAVVYGDVRTELRALAALLDLPVVEL